MKRFFAFSLAEVMIAMAVIGVVAALVIPTHFSGATTKAYKTLFKSTFEQIQQGLVTAANVNKHAFVNVSSNDTLPNDAKYTIERFMQHHFGAKLITRNAAKDEIPEAQITNGKTFLMRNGAHIVFTQTSLANMDDDGCTNSKPCDAYIDVNGNKGPNTIITCTTGEVSNDLDDACTITSDAVKDIFPVVIKMDRIYPKTNAANYILNN